MRSRRALQLTALIGAVAIGALTGCSSSKSSGSSSASSAAASVAAPATTAATTPASSAPAASAATSAPASSTAAASSPASSGASTAESNVVAFQAAVPGSGKGIKIGLITLDDSVPFSKLVSDSVKKQAAADGATLVYCDSKGDGATALACAKTFKVEGVQGYLNFQSDAKSADAICAAGPSGPVIAIDIEQGNCQTAFMGANNQYAGYLAGVALGNAIKTKFNCKYDAYVSMEEPAAGAVNTERMVTGYQAGFSSVCGPITNLKTENAFRIDQAQTTFTDVLTTLPSAHVIVVAAINDDAIEGALAAAKTAGRTNDLYVSGQGADPSSWCDIKSDPQWIGDTAYFPERYGEIGVPYLIAAIKGQSIPKLLLVPHQIINQSNISTVYDTSSCK
jgi:ribose transport system substrate-binding protein